MPTAVCHRRQPSRLHDYLVCLSIYCTNIDHSTLLPHDGAGDALEVPQDPSDRRYSFTSSRRPSTYTRSQRAQSVMISDQDANKLMVEALAIQEQHDLDASDVNRRRSTISTSDKNNNNNKRLSIRPETYAAASNFSQSRHSLSVIAEDPSLLFAKALREHQQSKDLFRSESKRREGEEEAAAAVVAAAAAMQSDDTAEAQQGPSFSFSPPSP